MYAFAFDAVLGIKSCTGLCDDLSVELPRKTSFPRGLACKITASVNEKLSQLADRLYFCKGVAIVRGVCFLAAKVKVYLWGKLCLPKSSEVETPVCL